MWRALWARCWGSAPCDTHSHILSHTHTHTINALPPSPLQRAVVVLAQGQEEQGGYASFLKEQGLDEVGPSPTHPPLIHQMLLCCRLGVCVGTPLLLPLLTSVLRLMPAWPMV